MATMSELQEGWFHQEFWPAFWRKKDKQEALKAFKKHATREAKKDSIVAAVKRESPEMLERLEQHRPYAATWLNKRRYLDEPEPAANTKAPSGAQLSEWTPPWKESANG